jgi:hypothetical protein
VAATEFLAFHWICGILRNSSLGGRSSRGLGIATAAVLAVDPWAWNTIAFDFHAHVISTLFVVLAGRDLWSGRSRRPLVWATIALLCGGPSALYVVGVGLGAAFASPRVRRTALGVVSMGIGWFVFLTQVGGDGVGGAGLSYWYGYIAGSHSGHVGLGSIASGAITHPDRLVTMLGARWITAFVFLAVVGILGVFSPWGFFMAAVVFLPTVFNADPSYLRIPQSFQSWPAIPFVLVGSISVLTWLLSHERETRRAAILLTAWWLTAAGAISATVLPKLPNAWLTVTPSASAELVRVERLIPSRAEVIAIDQVVGRFATRPDVYKIGAQWNLPATIPLRHPVVVFVIVEQQRSGPDLYKRRVEEIAAVRQLGAKQLVANDGVYAFEWVVPPGVASVTII